VKGDGILIRAVLWDFGGVVTSSPFEAFNRFERERALPLDFLRGVNSRNPDGNAWARFERSEIDLDTFDRLFLEESTALGHAVGGRDVIPLLGGEIRPEMVEALRRCNRHFLTACITNNVRAGSGMYPDGERAEAACEVLKLFHLVLESSETGLRKPDPRIYCMACEKLGVEPGETVYLDDLGINLKPARGLGMQTIKVGEPGAALVELEAVLGIALS
jgi:putative hydrolase of the HAD superfamily